MNVDDTFYGAAMGTCCHGDVASGRCNTAYVVVLKKNGKSELAAAVALYPTCGDGEWRPEVYGCAADRQQASIVFDVTG